MEYKILKDHTDVSGNFWSVVFVFEVGCPDWAWECLENDPNARILCFNGYENALAFIK